MNVADEVIYAPIAGVKIWLGSKSPRRLDLLQRMGFSVELLDVNVEEEYPENLGHYSVAEYLANKKMDAIKLIPDSSEIVLTADTTVVCQDQVINKPNSVEEAIDFLHLLSGTRHKVISGVALKTAQNRTSFSVSSEVTFADIPEEAISYYTENHQVLDKAGAYGIQDWIGLGFITHINGSYENIVGLPTQRTMQEILVQLNR